MTEALAGPLRIFCAWCAAESVETILQEGAVPEHAGVPQMSGGICPRHYAQEMTRWQAVKGRIVICPFCGRAEPRPKFGFWGQPEGPYAELLRCPECVRFFAPVGVAS